MRIVILSSENTDIPIEMFPHIAGGHQGVELLGQLLDSPDDKTLDVSRISHYIKDVHYDKISQTVNATLEIIDSPFGNQLRLIMGRAEKNLSFSSIFAHTLDGIRLKRVDAIFTKTKEEPDAV